LMQRSKTFTVIASSSDEFGERHELSRNERKT
jgi:hypothetical protein